MELEVLRALERLLVVGVGGLAIYLGYRLFLKLPERRDGEGKLELPGGISIYISRVGPGAFLALFGTAVVALSFSSPAVISRQVAPAPGERGVVESYKSSYFMQGLRSGADVNDVDRARVRAQLLTLNRLGDALREDMSAGERAELERQLRGIKLSLIGSVWESDWGDPAVFHDWVLRGADQPPPQAVAEPARLFDLGEQGSGG